MAGFEEEEEENGRNTRSHSGGDKWKLHHTPPLIRDLQFLEEVQRLQLFASWYLATIVKFTRECVTLEEFGDRTWVYFRYRLEGIGIRERGQLEEGRRRQMEKLWRAFEEERLELEPTQQGTIFWHKTRVLVEEVEPEWRRMIRGEELDSRRQLGLKEFEYRLLNRRSLHIMEIWTSMRDVKLHVESTLNLDVRETDERKRIEMTFLDTKKLIRNTFVLELRHKQDAERARRALTKMSSKGCRKR